MDIKSFVAQADRVFNCAGDSCDFGCHESAVPKMIEYVKEHLPGYHYCVIADWVWIDINVTPEELKYFDERGVKPSVIYAHKVIDDEAGRPFESVRTTFLQDFQQNCVFLSRNTAYILHASGTRVTIDSLVFATVFS
jgi:Domain of unknown function (DUF6957)